MCRNRSRLFFRNKYTTTRLRSLANMFLSRIFVIRYNSTLSGFFHGAFHRLLLFTKKIFFAPIILHLPFALRNQHYKNKTKQIAACSAQKKYLFRFVKRFGLVSFVKRRSKQDKPLFFFNARKVSTAICQTI